MFAYNMPPPSSPFFDTGVIVQSFPDQEAYTVQSDNTQQFLQGCQSIVGGLFLPAFGIKSQLRLAVGTRVLLVPTSPALIISCIPNEPPTEGSANLGRVTTGAADIEDLGSEGCEVDHITQRVPKDQLEGEYGLVNALQVGVRFLTHLVKMQAGDRAKVECFLLDDLVRIVSGSFRHMSDFGEHEIYNDGGRLNVRYSGTSYAHEADGVLKPKDPRVKEGASGVLPDTPVAETGRWRYSQFIGYLGDFIHMFVTDPGAALGELAQDRAGKFHAHVNQDGSLVVQSVADITFERVSRIVVPQELKHPANPEGDKPEDFAALNTEFLDTWKVDPQRPWTLAYHIRDYARWLNTYHAYARFQQHTKDWMVASESMAPEPSYGGDEQDKQNAIPEQQRKPRITYSCIRIFRDGSQLMLDGYGGCVLQAGGSTVVSAPIDVRIEAGRNVTIIAGRNIFAKAHRNMELVAVTGALIQKARTRLSAFCEKGTILLKTFMKAGPPEGDSDPKEHRFVRDRIGIVIDAPDANVLVASGNMLTLEGTGAAVDKDQRECGVRVQSGKDNIELSTGQEGAVRLRAKVLSARVATLLLQSTKAMGLLAPFINLGNLLYKGSKGLVCGTFTAKRLKGEFISHGQAILRGKVKHKEHVIFDGGIKAETPDDPEELTEELKEFALPAAAAGIAGVVGARGDYLQPNEYPQEPVPQSPAQQLAEAGGLHPAAVTFENWDFSQDGQEGDSKAVFKLPFPGARGQMESFSSSNVLHQISSKAPAEFKPVPTEPEKKPMTFQRWTPPTS
jgi:hypothetical protein